MTDASKTGENVSNDRRGFLRGLGLLGGATVIGGAFASSPEPAVVEAKKTEPPAWPWPYSELNPDRAAEMAHKGYYEGKCAYGTFKAIIAQLAETHGAPFSTFPLDMMRYGEGGVNGWGGTCGTLNAASAAINLVCSTEDAGKLIDELIISYASTEHPVYTPPGAEPYPSSISNSPLCHVSTAEWCKKSGFAATSKERRERCARLCGDVARKTVELLNAHHKGTFAPALGLAPAVEQCMTCHGPKDINNATGKMDCLKCHDPHE